MKRTRIVPINYRFQKKSQAADAKWNNGLLNVRDIIRVLLENPLFSTLTLLLLLGTVLGALFARSADDSIMQKLDLLFLSDIKARAMQSSGAAFVASLGSSFLFVAVCFLLGMSLWGMLFLPLVPLFRGFGFGLTSGYLYAAYGFQGVLFNAVVVLPGAFLSMISILLAAKEGIGFSKKTLFEALRKEQSNALTLKEYAIRLGSALILSAAAAAIDLITAVCFSGAFSF